MLFQVVIAMIAILTGVLLPALSKAKERAKRIACLNHLKQLALATLMYADDHENRLPRGGTHFVHWADMTRKLQDSWGRPGGPDPQTRGVNHFNRAGDAPEGSTEAYLDGHVRWVPFVSFRARPKLRLESTAGVVEHYFHAGREDVAVC